MAATTFSGPMTSTAGFVGNQVDANGNEVIIETGVASAVNEITVTNAATATQPSIAATGDNSNISLRLTPKGTGVILPTVGPIVAFGVTVSNTTAGALTYTAAMLKAGLIKRNPSGAARSDVTPTAALLLAAVPGAVIGTAFEFTITNDATAAETITVTAGTGATLTGTMTIAQNNSKRFRVEFTNVTAASEAYTVYSLGTVTT